MISASERQPEKVEKDFYYWAKLLAGKFIVNVVVYGDESTIHDLSSKEIGAAVLAGYGGFADDWYSFYGRWQKILNDYLGHVEVRKRIFHFSQFSDKKNRSKDPTWPYYGWSDGKRDDFLYELASVAGNRVRIPFASGFRLAYFNKDSDIKAKLKEIGLTDAQINGSNIKYISLFAEFFEAFLTELNFRHPNFSDSISFVFDDRNDREWAIAGYDVHRLFKEKDKRFIGSPTFGNTFDNIPLQAADMMAYRAHQLWENAHKAQKEDLKISKLDFALWGNFKDESEFANYVFRLLCRNSLFESGKAKQPVPSQKSLVHAPWRSIR